MEKEKKASGKKPRIAKIKRQLQAKSTARIGNFIFFKNYIEISYKDKSS
jgi:hypothetical protein